MSKKPADRSIDEQTFEALEDALKIDLDDDSIDHALDDVTLDELETKVSNAAKELKSAQSEEPPQSPGNSTEPRTAAPAFAPAASLAPANDDSRKTPQACCVRLKSAQAAARFAMPPSCRCFGRSAFWVLPTCSMDRKSGRSARSRTFLRCPRQSALPSPSSYLS
jgi:hypothetical protein